MLILIFNVPQNVNINEQKRRSTVSTSHRLLTSNEEKRTKQLDKENILQLKEEHRHARDVKKPMKLIQDLQKIKKNVGLYRNYQNTFLHI